MCRISVIKLLTLVCFHAVLAHEGSVSLCDVKSPYHCKCSKINSLAVRVNCFGRKIKVLENASLPLFADTVDLSRNEIEEVVKFLPSSTLKSLMLNRNKIEYIEGNAFEGLPNLELLDLSENRIANLSLATFHGVVNLKMLNLADNNFKKFDRQTFLYLPILKELNLNDNDLGFFFWSRADVFDVEGISVNNKLETLHLKNNSITGLCYQFFSSAYTLKKIDLSYNNFSSLPVLPDTLEYLDISANHIETFESDDFKELPLLRHLIANHMLYLNDIKNNTFLPLNKLENLQLENCNFNYFNPYSFGVKLKNEYYPEYNTTLKHVSFLGSGLTTLEKHLSLLFWNLTTFDIRGNPWKCDCKITWILRLNINEEFKENIRCYYPVQLEYQQMFMAKEEKFSCPTHLEVLRWLIVNGLIVMCTLLSALAMWLVYVWPKRNSNMRSVSSQSAYAEITIEPNRAEHY